MKRMSLGSVCVVAIFSMATALITGTRPLGAAPPPAATGDASKVPTQIPGHNALLMGADWYPEQWAESRWETDV